VKGTILILLALIVGTGTVQSQSPLTDSQVERFLNTLDKLNDLPELHAETVADPAQMDAEELERRMRSPFTSSLFEMRLQALFAEAVQMMQSEGFADEVEWARVGDRVMRAYTALKMEGAKPAIDEEMARALEQLEESELSDDMKQKMREVMTIAKEMAETTDEVPAGDIAALRPHVSRFEKIAERSAEQYQH
jgi:hypothetical protein